MEKLKSIWQIDEKILPEIRKLYDDNEKIYSDNLKLTDDGGKRLLVSYSEQLKTLYDKYLQILSEFSLLDDMSCSIKDYNYIVKDIRKYKNKILNLFDNYSKGKFAEAAKIEKTLFFPSANASSASSMFPHATIMPETYWFRSRRLEFNRRFGNKDLFHVPFEKRGKIGASRYSIPGYPCLYLGATINCAVEETGNDVISAVSCFKNMRELDSYDFRFFSPNANDDMVYLNKALVTYPFKIAASIPVGTYKYKEQWVYKEEYVIPQLLLHCALRKNGPDKPQCIMYTSTKAIVDSSITPSDFPLHDNIVVPTLYSRGEGICGYLNAMFTMTSPEIVPSGYMTDNEIKEMEVTMKKNQFNKV